MAEISGGEHHVIAAAHHLVKALEATNNLSNDTRRLLADLDTHLSTIMMRLNEGKAENNNTEIETRLVSAHHTITSMHSNIWDSNGPTIAFEYLQAVAEVQRLTTTLQNMPLNKNSRRTKELCHRAQSILHTVMDRLESELISTLVQNKRCFEHQHVSIPACEEENNPIYEESILSNEDDSVSSTSQRERSSSETEEYAMDLIHPDVIPQIKSIANIMFDSGYDREFRRAFTAFWRDTLDEYMMTILDVEQFSIEDVVRMEWKILNSRIKKWCFATKSIINVYLASAKRIFHQVLGEYGHISLACLIEASKAPIMCLLNFGQAVSIGPHKPEWLFCLLDMYEVLAALIPDVDALFPEEIGSLVRIEFRELLTRLGDSAKVIWDELGNHISSCSSTTPFAHGGIHPLTKYVMNYILFFAEYADTLNLILRAQDSDRSDESRNMATHLRSLTSTLEANLDHKSNLYRDTALKHIFMMNNIHYMVRKIRNSKISPYFGEEWMKHHVVQFRQHATWYERATWNSILDLLRVDDGKVGKATLKARSRAFATAFEGVYKNQTRWCVADFGLREDLRISASKTVIHAYRNFVSKITSSIGEKSIKYSEQDLGAYILDLLEGSSKSLNYSQRR